MDLLETMNSLGLNCEKVNLSGISPAGSLFISKLKQTAYIDVNEKGTEAAAVTSADGSWGEGPSVPEKPKVFNANQPFIFLIKEKSTGSILFIGRIKDPSPE